VQWGVAAVHVKLWLPKAGGGVLDLILNEWNRTIRCNTCMCFLCVLSEPGWWVLWQHHTRCRASSSHDE
jgi:hypothetical protein